MKSPKKLWDVVVVGDLFIDEILSDFFSLPKLGEEAFARSFKREVGGGAAITACGLARLGLKVAVIGAVGAEDSDWFVGRLEAAKVNADELERHPIEPTGVTVSASTREDRAFLSYYGANIALHDLLMKAHAQRLMAQAKHVHFACTPDRALFPILKKENCRISIDVGWHPSWLTNPANLPTLQESDLFFPNRQEAELITGETEPHSILRAFREQGLRAVGLKLGGNGAALLWRKREFMTETYPVVNLDTTGAGDCFDAGFIYGWLQKFTPKRCLEIANVCGALSTRALGGVAAFPLKDELDAVLKNV